MLNRQYSRRRVAHVQADPGAYKEQEAQASARIVAGQ